MEISVIELDRREVTRFRAAVRRCVAGRPRGLTPPVVLEQSAAGLTLSTVLGETALALRLPPAGGPHERLVLPFSTLAALDGPGGGVATFAATDAGQIHCCWQDRGGRRELDGEPVPAEQPSRPLPPVGKLQPADPSLLAALHACGQTASREPGGRFALQRLQLRGRHGEVAGTDGRQLLLWGGFAFPFRGDLLVPAVPVFGSRDFAGQQDVRIGHAAQHVAVAGGPWLVWLAVDVAAPYPDVTTVLPRSSPLAKLLLDEADAAALLSDLRHGPPSGDEVVPVVVDLGPRPAVRWPDGTPGRRGPLNLIRSTSSGPAIAVRLDPTFLARALSLGFREVCTTSGESPVLFRDGHRDYLVANFGPAAAPGASSANRQSLPAARGVTGPLPQPGEEPMNPAKDGGAPTDHPPAEDVLDPLTEAEALRVVLPEMARRVGRLILSLRQIHKQRRALDAALTSLKHLRLGPREEP